MEDPRLQFPIRNFGGPPARPPFNNAELAPGFDTFAANKQLLNWGAHQVKWRKPLVDMPGNLPVSVPATPNLNGVSGMIQDKESRAYSSPVSYGQWGLDFKPTPFWLGK